MATTEDHMASTDTPGSDQMAAQPPSFTGTKADDIINTYITPVVIIFGTFGNILCLVVLQGRRYKTSTTSLALSALALADIGVLNTGLLRKWILQVFNFDVRYISGASCTIHATLTYYWFALSANLLALTSIERAISVLFPFKVKDMLTRKRMMIMIGCCAIGLLLCHIPSFYVTRLYPSFGSIKYSCRGNSRWFYRFWQWFTTTLDFFLPFALILASNIVIITCLKRAARKRSQLSNVSDQTNQRNRSTTVMLVVVGLVFLVTNTPSVIFNVGDAYDIWYTGQQSRDQLRDSIIQTVMAQLSYVNNAVNFILYFISGSKFREAMYDMFCGRFKKKKKNVQSSTSTGVSWIN